MDPSVEKILKLPKKQRILFFVLVMLLEAAALVWFLYKPVYQEHEKLKGELSSLQNEIDDKTRIVSNLPRLQHEYDMLSRDLAQALTELPNSKEIPSLLTSITTLGKNAGLDFLVFRPQPEVLKDFYSEVPVDITIAGSFYSVANFFSAVSNLSRIVNITNVNFAEVKNLNNRVLTRVNCLATTFRFLDKKEIKDDSKTANK